MREPSLIRIFDRNMQFDSALVEHFDHGFTVPRNHPFEPRLLEETFGYRANLVVLDTDEVHWKIDRVTVDVELGTIHVECEPWIEGLRRNLLPDSWHYAKSLRLIDPRPIAASA